MTITLIGISDSKLTQASKEVLDSISNTHYFAGGKRHFELVKHLLPETYQWTNITIPLHSFFETLRDNPESWIIFASGDPYFFGIGNTLKREFPSASFKVFPSFNSLQLLAHKVGLAYGEYRCISLTGRNWDKFDAALIRQEEKLALLTDKEKTPNAIAARMLNFGYSNYRMWIGEHLGGEKEQIYSLSLEEAIEKTFAQPNCLYLQQIHKKKSYRGILDSEFEGLPNRPKMITKMPFRIACIALMDIVNRYTLWDVGACTGSISIESKLQNPLLKVYSFEKRVESEGIISRNCSKFGTPGIEIHIGDFLDINKSSIQRPDVVFIGGYGGAMETVLDEVDRFILENGIIVFNAVSDESKQKFVDWARQNKYNIDQQLNLSNDNNNPITTIAISRNK